MYTSGYLQFRNVQEEEESESDWDDLTPHVTPQAHPKTPPLQSPSQQHPCSPFTPSSSSPSHRTVIQVATYGVSLYIKNMLSKNFWIINKLSQSIYSYKIIFIIRTRVTKNKFRGSLGVCYNETPLYTTTIKLAWAFRFSTYFLFDEQAIAISPGSMCS